MSGGGLNAGSAHACIVLVLSTLLILIVILCIPAGREAPLIADDVYEIIMKNKEELDSAIIYDRDYSYDYFGFKTLERSYLLRVNGTIAERPQVSSTHKYSILTSKSSK